VFLVASLLTALAPVALADMDCRTGHLWYYEARETWYCNPGGENCLYCTDEIIVRG